MSAPTAKQAVLNTMNIVNEVEPPLTFTDVSFSLPTAGDGTRGNTAITVTPTVEGRLVGPARPYYFNRLPMADWLKLEEPLEVANPVQIVDLLPALNAVHRVNLIPEDLANGDVELGPIGAEPVEVTLIASEDSYGWLGQLKVVLQRVSIPLSEVIADTVLDGLVYDGLPADQ